MFDNRSTALHQTDPVASSKLAVVVTVFGMLAAPAFAAPSVQVPCRDASEATLHVSDTTLATEFVNHNSPVTSMSEVVPGKKQRLSASSSLLAPRAEAAIRDAFEGGRDQALTTSQPELARAVLALPVADTDAKSEQDKEAHDAPAPDAGMNAKLPGISDDDLTRYKKQMYRRDI